MPSCARCSKRVGARNLARTALAYNGDEYRMDLCKGCRHDWDAGVWSWLSFADEEPSNDPTLGCYACGTWRIEDRIEVGYDSRTWYFSVCATDSKAWSTFLWSWIKLAESVPKTFEWQSTPKLKAPPPAPPPPATRPGASAVAVCDEEDTDDYQLANHVALQLRDLGLTWNADVVPVLRRPVAVADTDVEGVRRYMTPTLTVFVNEIFRLVVGVRKEKGYRQQGFSPEARAYRLSAHTRERMEERHISHDDILRALDDRRKMVTPDRTKQNVNVILTDDIKMAVDETAKEVITVCWRGCTARVA